MTWDRAILHVDMDAFFAAIEQRDEPALRGKPVLVGHDGPRGVVSAASYEARKFGCRSAQPTVIAKRLCPQAIVVRGDHAKYRAVSRQIMGILADYSPVVEPLSIDEAFVDLTGSTRLLGEPPNVARDIKRRIRAEIDLTASIGVAPNKFLAKLASDLEKPDGLTVIGPDDIDRVLPPLPVTRLWGVGPRMAETLARLGIRTIADLRRVGLAWLIERFGDSGEHFHRLAHGLDDRAVTPDHDAKSIGHETTFEQDLEQPDDVRGLLLQLTEQVGARLRRHARRAGTVHVKIRFGDFQTITRAATLREPTDLTLDLWHAAGALFDAWAAKQFQPVRLIGMSVSGLSDPGGEPATLFEHPTDRKQRRLDAAVDAINRRLGSGAIRRAGNPRPP
jgi:DNA polymerase-4